MAAAVAAVGVVAVEASVVEAEEDIGAEEVSVEEDIEEAEGMVVAESAGVEWVAEASPETPVALAGTATVVPDLELADQVLSEWVAAAPELADQALQGLVAAELDSADQVLQAWVAAFHVATSHRIALTVRVAIN